MMKYCKNCIHYIVCLRYNNEMSTGLNCNYFEDIGFEIPLSNAIFEEADEIIINGYIFKKIKEN